MTKLVRHEAPASSTVGLVVAATSLLVMPLLAWAKRRTGQALGSRALVADSRETVACAWLSAAVFLGLGLNALWGLWWADPVAALVVVGFLFKEGTDLLWGEDACGGCGKGEGEPVREE